MTGVDGKRGSSSIVMPHDLRHQHLLFYLDEEAEAALDTTNATAEERKEYDSVITKFNSCQDSQERYI